MGTFICIWYSWLFYILSRLYKSYVYVSEMKNISSDLRIKIEFSEYNFYRNILVRWVKNFKIVLFIGLVIFSFKNLLLGNNYRCW